MEVVVKEPHISILFKRNGIAAHDIHNSAGNASEQNAHNSAWRNILVHAVVMVNHAQKCQWMHSHPRKRQFPLCRCLTASFHCCLCFPFPQKKKKV